MIEGDPYENPRKSKYLAQLAPEDRKNVEGLVIFSQNLQGKMGETKIAVLAVGSTTLPPEERYHNPPQDLDIRILNSAIEYSQPRVVAVDTIKDEFRAFFDEKQILYQEERRTMRHQLVVGRKGKLNRVIDWMNEDPSILAQVPNSLPLHVSISGVDNLNLEEYLYREAAYNTSAVILFEG